MPKKITIIIRAQEDDKEPTDDRLEDVCEYAVIGIRLKHDMLPTYFQRWASDDGYRLVGQLEEVKTRVVADLYAIRNHQSPDPVAELGR